VKRDHLFTDLFFSHIFRVEWKEKQNKEEVIEWKRPAPFVEKKCTQLVWGVVDVSCVGNVGF
jgi:hypothetical protein